MAPSPKAQPLYVITQTNRKQYRDVRSSGVGGGRGTIWAVNTRARKPQDTIARNSTSWMRATSYGGGEGDTIVRSGGRHKNWTYLGSGRY